MVRTVWMCVCVGMTNLVIMSPGNVPVPQASLEKAVKTNARRVGMVRGVISRVTVG